MKALLRYKGTFINFGLLVMRAGIGVMMVLHGLPKLQGGPEKWAVIGSAVLEVGIDKYFTAWGLLAALTEVVGGVFFLAGLLFKPTTFALAILMGVAVNLHLAQNEGIMGAAHAIELGVIFFAFLISGPGKFSIDNSLFAAGGDDDDD